MPVQYTPHPIRATITYPARAVNVTYQNATLRPLMVIIRLNVNAAIMAPALSYAYGVGRVGPTTPPLNFVAGGGIFPDVRAFQQDGGYFTVVMMVPPGNYYSLDQYLLNGGWGMIWAEVEL